MLTIRPCTDADSQALWKILKPVLRAGDTYTIDPDIDEEDAVAYWCGPANHTFVAIDGTETVGTYYLRRNQQGGGGHVCNCGYITGTAARGKGVARALLDHSLNQACALGYRAMQYNFVVETNTRAISIWEGAGFDTVGRLPGAFLHPVKGYVDAFVMYRSLV